MSTAEEEIEIAVKLANILEAHPLPDEGNYQVAIFVFREGNVGFVSEVPLGPLRRILRDWVFKTKPGKPPKETIQ